MCFFLTDQLAIYPVVFKSLNLTEFGSLHLQINILQLKIGLETTATIAVWTGLRSRWKWIHMNCSDYIFVRKALDVALYLVNISPVSCVYFKLSDKQRPLDNHSFHPTLSYHDDLAQCWHFIHKQLCMTTCMHSNDSPHVTKNATVMVSVQPLRHIT